MRARWTLAVVAVLALVLAPAPGASAQSDTRAPERMLIVSVPGLTWADVEAHDLPEFERFFAGAALADLAPRGVSPRSGPGDAYLTISAGARATTEPAVDGQVLALNEQSSGSMAGEIFARRTGSIADGDFVALGWPALLRVNEAEPYDAVLGLLAETLRDEGVEVSVIGNADGTDFIGSSYERQVGLALIGTDGVVQGGALRRELLATDPAAVFGVRQDQDAVLERFDDEWGGAEGMQGSVVLVEASDLARTLRYRPMVGNERFSMLWAGALTDADRLFGRLMERVDPDRDTVLVVAPYNRFESRDLTAVALRSPGSARGYLESASTQREGFLTLVDIAPTVLNTFDIDRPDAMEGRFAEVAESSTPLSDRVDRLISLNDASRFRERLLVPTTVVIVLILALVLAGTVVAIAGRKGPPWRRTLAFLALVDLAVFPMSYVARAFDLEELGAGFYWGFLTVTAVALGASAELLTRRSNKPYAGLVAILCLVAGVLVFDVVTGSRLSLSAAFGYSPTGNSRLYGISNYSYGQLATAVCLLAAFLAARGDGLRGRGAAIFLLVATLVVLGVPIWGSDVGGILAFTPTILVFVALVFGRRLRLRTVVAAALATVVAVTAFGLLDLARPPEQRAHLGRLFERVGDEGLGPLFSIMERKLLANLQVSVSSFWVAVIPLAVAFWIFLVRFPSRPLDRVHMRLPTLGAGVAAAFVAAVLGSLVNDSGAILGGVAAAVLTASLAYLVLRVPESAPIEAGEPEPPPEHRPGCAKPPEDRLVPGRAPRPLVVS
ncbi:membrane protein [soil metagenome]